MKKVLLICLMVALAAVVAVAFTQQGEAAKGMGLKGTAYIAGHGGHLAVIDLATLKEPTDMENGRIVISEAGSEMEGVIAGMQFEEVKKGGGTHGGALSGENLVVGLLNGNVVVYNTKTGKKTEPMAVGKKFCDAIAGPDGNIYLEDMADGHVYVWDPKGMKTVDKIPVGASVCGIAWTKGADKAYVSDMPQGKVFVLDWKTKKTIKEITDPEMTFIHQIKMSPDQRYLWVAAPNEYDPGLKPATHKSQVVVIDTKTDKVVDHIVLPEGVFPHDFEFSPDGKTVLLASRTYAADSELIVMDYKTHDIKEKVSACAACHKAIGVEVKIDKGSPLLCGIEVAWQK